VHPAVQREQRGAEHEEVHERLMQDAAHGQGWRPPVFAVADACFLPFDSGRD
jgi:hypothetical protein